MTGGKEVDVSLLKKAKDGTRIHFGEHPLPGTGNKPVWHVGIGKSGGNTLHIPAKPLLAGAAVARGALEWAKVENKNKQEKKIKQAKNVVKNGIIKSINNTVKTMKDNK